MANLVPHSFALKESNQLLAMLRKWTMNISQSDQILDRDEGTIN